MVREVCHNLQLVTGQLQKLMQLEVSPEPDIVNLNVGKALTHRGIDYTSTRPGWAQGMVDKRQLLDWDSEQFITQFAVNGKLALGVADTGSCKTLMCERRAAALGLSVERARGNEFGSYKVPGADDVKAYVGVVRGPLELQFGEKVRLTLPHIRVLTHPHPLVLIGSDLLRGGDVTGARWNCDGLHWETVGQGHVEGGIAFSRGGVKELCPLVFCPAEAITI